MAGLTPERLAEIKRRLARAREQHRVYGRVSYTLADMTTLAELLAEIDRLRAENDRLRAALQRWLADSRACLAVAEDCSNQDGCACVYCAAQAALGDRPGKAPGLRQDKRKGGGEGDRP